MRVGNRSCYNRCNSNVVQRARMEGAEGRGAMIIKSGWEVMLPGIWFYYGDRGGGVAPLPVCVCPDDFFS